MPWNARRPSPRRDAPESRWRRSPRSRRDCSRSTTCARRSTAACAWNASSFLRRRAAGLGTGLPGVRRGAADADCVRWRGILVSHSARSCVWTAPAILATFRSPDGNRYAVRCYEYAGGQVEQKRRMRRARRSFLKFVGSCATLAAAGAVGLLRSAESWAASWNKTGFESRALTDALKSLGAASPVESRDIVITAPDIAENSALVPVAVASKLPNTQQISIVAEKNPFPLAATFDVANGAEGYVRTDLKMGQTSDIWAVVRADGKFYVARTEVKMTVAGCG